MTNRGSFVYTRLLLHPRTVVGDKRKLDAEAWTYVADPSTTIRWDGVGFMVDIDRDGFELSIEVPSEDVIGVCIGPQE